ncbi:MAG TPA: hypothetical protein VFN25_01340 [Dokdonella sp.]|uniref:hypothetical protein n=1 Tax=Dokdonella sp. TaxID=2291710 RepID=UPI002D7EB910|nr:hypothetical protein [Dokdonella sp.]HET9031526.1 hypothetical protein [Dokdonella sp.]
MKKPITTLILVLLAALVLAACQSNPARKSSTAPSTSSQRAWFDGEYDNHEQVVQAQGRSVPRVRFEITPLQKPGWYVWRVDQSGSSVLTATWVMRSLKSVDGTLELTPYRSLAESPLLGKDFDQKQWIALDACALHGAATSNGLEVRADLASCQTVAPGVGPSAALLPLSISHDGDSLHVRLYADQARGPDARVDARKIRWYSGWAAINGAGPDARPESTDWHMNRDLRISNEGGKAALKWRDGQNSGYSLELERATYRDGNVQVVKLSVIDDASGRVLAYSWANPEATRIGINLGWVQVGLDSASPVAPH